MSEGGIGESVVVVDASIGVKWLVPEVQSEAALLLLGPGFRLHTPSLFYTEVAQTLWKMVHQRKTMSVEEGREGIQALLRVPIVPYPHTLLLEAAFRIATETGRTVYDSVYLALAESLGCAMVTADLRLFNSLQGGPFEDRVANLDDVRGIIEG